MSLIRDSNSFIFAVNMYHELLNLLILKGQVIYFFSFISKLVHRFRDEFFINLGSVRCFSSFLEMQ